MQILSPAGGPLTQRVWAWALALSAFRTCGLMLVCSDVWEPLAYNVVGDTGTPSTGASDKMELKNSDRLVSLEARAPREQVYSFKDKPKAF